MGSFPETSILFLCSSSLIFLSLALFGVRTKNDTALQWCQIALLLMMFVDIILFICLPVVLASMFASNLMKTMHPTETSEQLFNGGIFVGFTIQFATVLVFGVLCLAYKIVGRLRDLIPVEVGQEDSEDDTAWI